MLQAQFFSKLPFGDHVIEKSRQLSNVDRQNKRIKLIKEIIFSLVTPCGILHEEKTDETPRWLLSDHC